MRCSSCETDNPRGSRLCNQCGAPLDKPCAECGFENISNSRYCAQCGTRLEAARFINAERGASDRVGGERRHLTVLFSDLVGSTEIASHLDPEQWREIVADYHRAAAAVIERYGGMVAQYLGDGVMAYFGWPEAHDNDAERGIHAGLAMLGAVSKLNDLPDRPKLSVRIGIDSGAVVVGGGTDKSADVFGDTPNIAARVQSAALPDTVVITDAVHRLVSGLFVVEERGEQTLKGIEKPIQLYRVVQPSGVRGRLQALAATHGLTPFVGREDELRTLTNRWERVLEGEGQVALVIGEAGIGKSRLLQHFHELIAETPHTWIEASAGALYQNTPFYPVAELLRGLLMWRGDEPPEEQLARLGPALEVAGLKISEALPLITPLMNLPLPKKYPPLAFSVEQQRRRLLTMLVEWVLGVARARATIVAIEDLHWVDPSTLELIQLLVEQGAAARLLLLYTARPEFHALWPFRAHHTQITLNRLSVSNVRTMVVEAAAHKALSQETIEAVIDRTGGVPLFVEELTQAVLEDGDSKLAGRAIPVTLHDSLMARLDRLGPAKEVIQVGAVIGAEFSYELLRAVYPIAEEHLLRSLRHLADAELLYVRGLAPEATYSFKHALIRDAAYEALLKSRRKELHGQVARTMKEKFLALTEVQPEVLARHWTDAGETEPAIAEWSRAGAAAQARNAFKEALKSYEQALTLLHLLPESSERDSRELELRQLVIGLLFATRGYGAPETVQATQRASELAEKTGNVAQFIGLVISRGISAFSSGELRTASKLADQALELARRERQATSLGFIHMLQLATWLQRGDLARAEEHFTAGLGFFDDPGFRQSAEAYVMTFGFASTTSWMLGRADVARKRVAQAILSTTADHPYEMAWSKYWAAQLEFLTGGYEQAEALAKDALELTEKNQLPLVGAWARWMLGRALTSLGRPGDGIILIRQAIDDFLKTGARTGLVPIITSLAVAQEREGTLVEALETVEQALRLNSDELLNRPETLMLRGELLLKQGQIELAEANYSDAIALAKNMSAKAWELRAMMSLVRLLDSQRRRNEARTMLAEIYNSFTEGFDTADLKDAKALLDELSR
jgi:class 3 adenylate cyclase/tetratricopeptide (TPR) repeat protein